MAEINNGDNQTKVIAFYLPQYHAIPENDKAWGEGFTEWTNVKKAVPYFKGHYQPRVPLNHNYYNLLNPEAQEWQSDLAQKYNVFGFCYYHYWVKDGKMLLEKPAENMLANENITEPFCFCWANENWSKTWTGNDEDLIAVQDYGGQEDWKKHFNYLVNFFRDERYITLDGKPVFIIYKPELMPDFKGMVSYFKSAAIEAGFPGLEVMVQFPTYLWNDKYDESAFDHYIDFEPAYTTYLQGKTSGSTKLRATITKILGQRAVKQLKEVFNKPHHYNYDDVWNEIISRVFPNNKFVCGGFTDWDNSPRKKRSVVFDGASPEKFSKYLNALVKKAKQTSVDVVFLDAWNEWGEGAYLEPDEKYKHAYLEAVRDAIK